MQTHAAVQEKKVPPVDGKPVLPIDRYEARVLEQADHFTVVWPKSGPSLEAAQLLVTGGTRALMGRSDCLVYAVTAEGRSCCVTPRVVKVHQLIYGGERT